MAKVEIPINKLLGRNGTAKRLSLSKKPTKSHKKENFESTHPCKFQYIDQKYNNLLTSDQSPADQQQTILDQIDGNLKIHPYIALDFTYSNGEPLAPDSLHYLNKDGSNEYVSVLNTVGSWICSNSDEVAVYGFGATLKTEVQGGHRILEFQEEMANLAIVNDKDYFFSIKNESDSMTSEITKVVKRYKEILPEIQPGGPTYLAPMITNLQKSITESDVTKNFYLLLILTDGVCNDERELKQCLVDISDKPVICIIIGVGPTDFASMFDLQARVNRAVGRSVMFFRVFRSEQFNEDSLQQFYSDISREMCIHNLKMGATRDEDQVKCYSEGHQILENDLLKQLQED